MVRKLARGRLPPTFAEELAENNSKQASDKNNNNNTNKDTTNTTNHNNDNNNDDNNYNNNKRSQESGLNSYDLDNENPESEPDLDSTSLGSFNPTLGVVSSLDQQGANQSLKTIGQQQTMTIGISLGSLIQQNQDGQKGMQIGTACETSLMHKRPKKKVSFDETNLAHNKQQQTIGNKQKSCTQRTSSLGSLGAALRSKSFQNKITKTQLAGIAFSKRTTSSNRLHQL